MSAITLDMLETPAAVVDLGRMERNLQRAADYSREHGLALRPHVKTHKSPLIAAAQLRLGARGTHLRHALRGRGDVAGLRRPAGGVSAGRRTRAPHGSLASRNVRG